MGLGIADSGLQIPKVLILGEGRKTVLARVPDVQDQGREKGHFVVLAGGPRTGGAGAKGRSL